MSFDFKLFGKSVLSYRSLENPSTSLSDAESWEGIFGNSFKAKTGAAVNAESSLKLTAVLRAVALLSGTMAALPLNVHRRDKEDNRELALDHPVYYLLHTEPNPMQSSFNFIETSMAHLVLSDGNFYWYIVRDNTYRPTGLIMLDPSTVTVVKVDYALWYFVKGVKDPIPARDMVHVAGMGFDGIKGKTPLRMARESIGQGLTLQDFASYFFANGTHVGGVIEHPQKMDQTRYDRFKKSWDAAYATVVNSNKTAILEGGAKYNKIAIPPEEAQFLQTRKFNVTEIARIFGVPPHKLYDLERSTNNNIEHQGIEFVQDAILILATRIEQELNRKLFREDERAYYYTKFNMNALLRGDITTRANYYTSMRNNSVMTANEIRKKEDLNPIPGPADELQFPLNMATETQLQQQKIKTNDNSN